MYLVRIFFIAHSYARIQTQILQELRLTHADSVIVTWWETNQTSDTPVMMISNNNGATFGPMLMLATNATIGETE
jgi:hypothetical protein